MKKANQTPSAGFTLLEVMIAVAITGGAIVMLLQAHGASVALHERCRSMLIAQHLIRELISEIEVIGYPGDIVEDQDISAQYPGFKWSRTVRMIGEDMPGVYEVIVVISTPVEKYKVMTHLLEEPS
jgi:prepilin-type N-terminal cleavage/methylation domain-containing protein